MIELTKWTSTIINVCGFIVAVSVAFATLRAQFSAFQRRMDEYVKCDRDEAEKWRVRHEVANSNAINRLDEKIETVNNRLFQQDGRPIYAYREEMETLRKSLLEGQQALRAEIKNDNQAHYEGVSKLIREMVREVKGTCSRA